MLKQLSIRKTVKYYLYNYWPWCRGSFPYFGVRLFFPPGSHLFERVCESGIYEQELLELLLNLVEDDSVYIDVGANIGLTSAPILRSRSRCSVWSFEPSDNALPYLMRSAQGSPFKDRWRVIGDAVGKECGQTDFYCCDRTFSAFDGLRPVGRHPAVGNQRVQLTTLDAEWIDAGRPRVSAIKIDVEGAELQVLLGAIDLLRSEQPAVLLEWNATNLDAHRCDAGRLIEFSREHGFDVLAVPSLTPVPNPMALRLMMQRTENFVLLPQGRNLNGDRDLSIDSHVDLDCRADAVAR